ncbi:hypothetical protein AMTRI_Chr03g146170 [Amborella trichopoda]
MASAENGSSQGEQQQDQTQAMEASAAPSEPTQPEQEKDKASAPPVAVAPEKKWPGWPGDNVFRVIVPVQKVGSIIGRKGELIKKMCEESRARIRILEGPVGTSDRIVLVSGKEEPEAAISPAMDGVLRVFKRVAGVNEGEGDAAPKVGLCSVRLLVASSQAINLIGKGGSLIKSVQESSGASVRVLSGDEVPFYVTSEERIVEIQGELPKVLKALEAVVGHLRKFLVDHSVIPLFEKSVTTSTVQERAPESWVDRTQAVAPASQVGVGADYSRGLKRDSSYLECDPLIDSQLSGLSSLYVQEPALTGLRSSGLGRSAAALVTQMTQTMQIPLSYAEDIIGVGGANIGYIRQRSGAVLTVQESRVRPDEITVEIKGTSQEVHSAQQLIQKFLSLHEDPLAGSYGKVDTGLRPYSQYSSSTYPSSSLTTPSLGGFGSSGASYGGFRL